MSGASGGSSGGAQEPVLLYDTTLRDGAQREGLVLSLQDKLRIARALDEFGMPAIEGGWPGSNPKDIEFFAAAKKIRWERAKLAAFGSTRHKSNRPERDPNLNALLDAETPIVTIFGKSWTLHVDEVIEATRAENLAMIAESVGYIARADARWSTTQNTSSTVTRRMPPMRWIRCAPRATRVPPHSSSATRMAAR